MRTYPVLYSYRRCPYAMRARMGIFLAGIQVEQREIVFWDKPAEMLQASPKGTVPVLVLPCGEVIDESRDILQWALAQSGSLLLPQETEAQARMQRWIDENDGQFKYWLDRYKYAEDYPEQPVASYREEGERFLQKLNRQLERHPYLLGDAMSMADIAIFPFVRQFANVDKTWFTQAGYSALKRWLDSHLNSSYFKAVMKNRPVWQSGHHPLWLDEPELDTRDQFTAKATAKVQG